MAALLLMALTFGGGLVAVIAGWALLHDVPSYSARACLRGVLVATALVPVLVPAPSLHGAFILPAYFGIPALINEGQWGSLVIPGISWAAVFGLFWFVGYIASLDTARRKAASRPS